MADNYLEKRYSEVFKKKRAVDPETGYEVQSGRTGTGRGSYSRNHRRHSADGDENVHKLSDQ